MHPSEAALIEGDRLTCCDVQRDRVVVFVSSHFACRVYGQSILFSCFCDWRLTKRDASEILCSPLSIHARRGSHQMRVLFFCDWNITKRGAPEMLGCPPISACRGEGWVIACCFLFLWLKDQSQSRIRQRCLVVLYVDFCMLSVRCSVSYFILFWLHDWVADCLKYLRLPVCCQHVLDQVRYDQLLLSVTQGFHKKWAGQSSGHFCIGYFEPGRRQKVWKIYSRGFQTSEHSFMFL